MAPHPCTQQTPPTRPIPIPRTRTPPAQTPAPVLLLIMPESGNDVLQQAVAQAERTATTATVIVEARSLSVIAGWNPVIRQSATVPVERVTAP